MSMKPHVNMLRLQLRLRLLLHDINKYYDYYHRYEFTTKPLDYYERQKIKFKMRYNKHEYDFSNLDNCKFIRIVNQNITSPFVTKYITNLNLKYVGMSHPPIIHELKLLKVLMLSDNDLIKPPVFNKLKLIRYIDISRNQLIMPPVVNHLKSLTYIRLSNNQLTASPIVDNLKSLKYLILSHNQLTTYPIINTLHALEFLDLSYNQLTTPPIVENLLSLRVLSLVGNMLSHIPIVDNLKFLKHVDYTTVINGIVNDSFASA